MKRVAIVGGSAFVLAAALAGAATVVWSGDAGETHRALAPVRPPEAPRMAPQPRAALPEPQSAAPELEPQPTQAAPEPATPSPAPARINWNLLVASFKATQDAAQNGGTAETVSPALKAAGELVTNAVMYATYSGDGERILTGLLNSLNGADLPGIAAATPPELPVLSPPDFSGLSEAYAAISSRPSPMGVTGPSPQFPAPQIALPPESPPVDLAFLMQPPPPPPIWLTLPGISQTPGLPS